MSIDYGRGTTANRDPETGIRYGVIHQHNFSNYALDDIFSNGEDLWWAAAKEELKDKISNAIIEAIEIEPRSYRYEHYKGIADDMAENFCDDEMGELYQEWEQGTTRYEADGVIVEWHQDGDVFVLKSPFVTKCGHCSPCAPEAGYLTSDGEAVSYCLPADWFDEESPCPYEIMTVDSYLKSQEAIA